MYSIISTKPRLSNRCSIFKLAANDSKCFVPRFSPTNPQYPRGIFFRFVVDDPSIPSLMGSGAQPPIGHNSRWVKTGVKWAGF